MTNVNRVYSVVLLKESRVSKIKNLDNTKIFEESIIIAELPEDFFKQKTQKELLLYFNKKITPLEYINGYEEDLRIEIIRIIDYFEIIDSIIVKDFTEVYSRHFIEETSTTVEDIIQKYYSDYVLVDGD